MKRKLTINIDRLFLATMMVILSQILYIILKSRSNGLMNTAIVYSDGKYFLFFCVVTFTYLFYKFVTKFSKVCSKKIHELRIFILIFSFVFIHILYFYLSHGIDISLFVRFISPSLGMMFIYTYIKLNKNDTSLVIYAVGILFAFLFFTYIVDTMKLRNTYNISMGFNQSYYLLLLLPLLLVIKNKKIEFLFLIMMGIAVMAAFKSTGMLAYFLLLLVYYSNSQGNKSKRIRGIFIGLTIALVFIAVFPYISNKIYELTNFNWLNKLNNTFNEGGSGRAYIWESAIGRIKEFNIKEIFFGKGYNMVEYYVGKQAHNDFIEIFFDYGILGTTLYLSIYANIISYIKKSSKKKSRSTIGFESLLAISLCLSMFSIFIMDVLLSLLFYFVLGALVAIYENGKTKVDLVEEYHVF